MKPAQSKQSGGLTQFVVLLRDYDYIYREDGTLISKGIPGYISDRSLGKFKNVIAACDYVCSVMHDKEFINRYTAYQNQQ
jgi:hypothetical protein